MAIGNLSNKISPDDANRVRDLRNPPEFEPGFDGGDSGSGGFDSLFDDISDSDFGFGDLGDGDFGGGSSNGGNSFGNTSFGNSSFGNSSFGNAGFGNAGFGNAGFGNAGFGNNQQAQNKPELLDKAIDYSGEAAVTLGKVIVELFKSISNRTADDFGYLSTNLIKCGVITAVLGSVIGLIGLLLGSKPLSFGGIPIQFIGAGALCCGSGFIGIGFSAIKIITTNSAQSDISVENLTDISTEIQDDSTSDYEGNIDDILDDLFSDDNNEAEDEDDLFKDDEDTKEISHDTQEHNELPVFAAPVKIDLNKAVEDIHENQYINRETLFNTFKTFLPINTPGFADRIDLLSDSDDFNQLETLALKALCNVAKCDIEDIDSRLESAQSTFFSYELKLKRVRGLKNTDELAREMEAYFREDSSDQSVNATVTIEGDYYKVIITKGESAVVTMGDVFKKQYASDFFLDTGNKLPMITGIDELGNVILDDAKVFDTMLIAGKPRSGKSWTVNTILMCFAMFNTPEDVEFIIVDPKESNLFKTFALMPHVIGLHNDKQILEIMDDIINNEAPRRKRLLSDNRCDDIWALRKKGVKLPILYLFIDEYITVRNNLGPLDKELDIKLQTIISQLPSLGIRAIIVPHRATGVVNKTNRTMIQYTACVKGDIEDVKDTLGIAKWTRALTKPGDTAIKTSTMQNAMYVRGAALTTSDEDNAELIKNVAKAFYKMGVDLPDNSAMTIAVNRDEEFIRQELQEDGHRIQFSTLNLDE